MKLSINTKFELKAKAFETMRFMLAPGKDQRLGPSQELREREWIDWCAKHGKVFEHFIKAVEELL